ncbi:TPA: DUF551 domain-containing protein [Klebsiella variicola subsp. variicola]
MTKSTITRERIQRIIRAINSEAYDEEEIREWLSSDEIMELSRMALAAMDSEPVAWTWQHLKQWHVTNDEERARDLAWDGVKVEPLYRHAQPAPEYPETLPCPVLLEPGLRFGKGIKTSTMLAALARRAVYESDMAALSPEERAEFQARIEGFKALIAQPAPVVPEEVTAEDCPALVKYDVTEVDEAWARGFNACRAAMLAAAPQPQNAPQNIPEIIPGWIPVSERMPETDGNYWGWWSESKRQGPVWFIKSELQAQFQSTEITHWMPLPAAPQEVQGE